jgi:hypothetical protein
MQERADRAKKNLFESVNMTTAQYSIDIYEMHGIAQIILPADIALASYLEVFKEFQPTPSCVFKGIHLFIHFAIYFRYMYTEHQTPMSRLLQVFDTMQFIY